MGDCSGCSGKCGSASKSCSCGDSCSCAARYKEVYEQAMTANGIICAECDGFKTYALPNRKDGKFYCNSCCDTRAWKLPPKDDGRWVKT